VEVLTHVGFEGVALMERFDCFRNTSMEGIARKYGVLGVNTYAGKSAT
jgi:hypothetical protein